MVKYFLKHLSLYTKAFVLSFIPFDGKFCLLVFVSHKTALIQSTNFTTTICKRNTSGY